MSYITIDDSDVDIIDGLDDVKVFIDLRGKDVEVSKLIFRADNVHIYVYDPVINAIIKIVNLPEIIEPSSINVTQRNGTITVIAKKISP